MEYYKVIDIIEKPITGEWGEEGLGIKVLRTTNFTNSGEVNYTDVVERSIESKKVEQKKLKKGDTILEKSGGSPSQPVGRVVYFEKDDDIYLCNNFTTILRSKSNVESKYLFWYLFNNHISKKTISFQNKTTGIINLQTDRYLSDSIIRLPPLETQKAIAEKLDKADALRKKDQELLKQYDDLAQAIFIDMFGDPVQNEKGWEVISLGEYLDVLTDYHANGSYEILKDNVTLLDEPNYALMVRTTDLENNNFINNVKYITKEAYLFLTKSKVYENDIIINKIGSAGNVYLMPKLNIPVSLGMNAFLLRFDEKKLKQLFVYFLLSSKYGKREMDKRIKGAVTKTIRKDAIKEIPIIIPLISLQNQFAEKIKNIEAQKSIVKQQAEESENLFQALLQQSFNSN